MEAPGGSRPGGDDRPPMKGDGAGAPAPSRTAGPRPRPADQGSVVAAVIVVAVTTAAGRPWQPGGDQAEVALDGHEDGVDEVRRGARGAAQQVLDQPDGPQPAR